MHQLKKTTKKRHTPQTLAVTSIAFLSLWSFSAAFASCDIVGKVLDENTANPLSRISVSVFRSGRSVAVTTSSDNDGSFIMSSLEPGIYAVAVPAIEGFRPVCVPYVRLIEGRVTKLDIKLRRSIAVEGDKLYGWSCYADQDSSWTEPREDWKREVIYHRVELKREKEYILTAWILTGDIGSGWGRDSRIRLAVDEKDAGLLHDFESIDKANVTQWFATGHQMLPVTLRFRARGDYVTIGAEFLQWWALEATHLYIDDFSIRPAVEPDDIEQQDN